MPFLSFLRQYGAREYGVTLAVAAIAGLAVAVLINSAPGGHGEPALLRTAPQEVAKTIAAKPKVVKPLVKAKPAARHAPARRHRRHRKHSSVGAPAPSAAPVVRAAPESQPSPRTTSPTTTSEPVVQAPAPAPKPTPKRAPKKSGGGIQFDDSG
jgi:hypothetical protein